MQHSATACAWRWRAMLGGRVAELSRRPVQDGNGTSPKRCVPLSVGIQYLNEDWPSFANPSSTRRDR